MVPKHQNETLALLRSKDPSSGAGSGHLCFVTSSPRASWLRPRFRKWGLLTPRGLCGAAGGLQPEGRCGVGGATGIQSRWGEEANWRCWTLPPLRERQQAKGSGRWLPLVMVGPGPLGLGIFIPFVHHCLPVTRTGAGMRRGSHFCRSEPPKAGQPFLAFKPHPQLERYGPVPLHGWLPHSQLGVRLFGGSALSPGLVTHTPSPLLPPQHEMSCPHCPSR